MYILAIFCTIYILFAIYLNHSEKDIIKTKNNNTFFVLMAIAIVTRCIISYVSEGYETDMNCFRSWSAYSTAVPPWDFYDSVWCDYPPGYLYILSVVGFLRNLFPGAGDVFLKLPSVICDVLCGVLIYKTATESCGKNIGETAGALYLFNVATFVNGSMWGQVDSVFTLLLVLSLIFLQKEKYVKSAIILGIGIAVKIQTVMFLPVYVFFAVEKFLITKDKKIVKDFVKSVIVTLLTVFAISLMYVVKKGVPYIVNLYFTTASQYPYASLNAFNLFSFLGANLKENNTLFLFMSYKVWGTISICISVLVCGIMYIKGNGKGKLFYTSGLLVLLIYTFSSDMHERYLFPAMALFFMAGVLNKDKRTQIIAFLISLLQAVNVGYLYYINLDGTNHIPADNHLLIWGSLAMVILAIYTAVNGFYMYLPIVKKVNIQEKTNKKIIKKDVIAICVLTVFYTILSFVNLGDTSLPETKAEAEGNVVNYTYVAELEKEENIGKIVYFRGIGKGSVNVCLENGDNKWEDVGMSGEDAVYRWSSIALDISAKKIRINVKGEKEFEIFEVGIIEKDTGKVIPVKNAIGPLFDEQEKISEWDSYKNGTYFDEIYHARTAYEHIKGIYPYEVSHPPLGKLIIALGIKMFGMTPFGWRFMGNVAGILMIPLMYLFAKRIFGKSSSAMLATVFLAVDFMHFVQTRIATIDSFAVLFIMLMYYLMYIYFSEEMSYKKSLTVLFLCGVTFGIGISTKWICVYAGAGLALIFALATIRKGKKGFPWFKTCLFCVLFFIIIPFAIYFASYIPYYMADKSKSAVSVFCENQKFMFSYHSKLTATHPFQSKWFTWPAVLRPIWYFGAKGGVEEGRVSSIVSMGNPIIWWCASVSAVVLMLKRKKNPSDWFIIIGYLSQFLPWVLINRAVFIYHYFASVPFIILALVKGCGYVNRTYKNGKYAVTTFVVLAFVVFIMFYPILSGTEISKIYVDNVLKWFESWTLSY